MPQGLPGVLGVQGVCCLVIEVTGVKRGDWCTMGYAA